MRTGILRVVLLLQFVLLFPFCIYGETHDPVPLIHADEASARLELKEKGSIFSIGLSADAVKPIAATLTAKILAPDDKLLAEASIAVQLGSTPRRAELPLKWVPDSGPQDVSSSRLFYEVRFEGRSTPAVSAILSPQALIPDLFELRFLGLDGIGLGHTYVARVWATRPDSDKPVSGVSLVASIGDDDEGTTPKGMKARARTNARGEGQLTFQLPETPGAPEDQEVDLEIRGTRGNFQNSLTTTLHYWRRAAILLSTDKPLYQPEQALHIRALILDDRRRAWAKQAVRFSVRDPDDTVVFSADEQTSRFGIASVDWSIPSSQKLGNYRVTAEISGDADSRELQGNQLVRISRYELPTFTVNVAADKPFYLPGQNADLTVSASYLFGKPVQRGHVRIVRETSRQWNYRDQKWETEEGQPQEGDLDAKSEFRTTLDLSKDHADLRESDWRRFEDLRYAAYVTDASSKRTQERHFDVRISRDPIHLYVLNAAGALPVGLRPVFYILSAFADGTPAVADVRVKLYTQDPFEAESSKSAMRAFATAQVRTNRYGIARVLFSEPLKKQRNDENKSIDRIYVALEAKSADGRAGRHLESYSLEKEPALRVSPVKAILRPGDPVEAEVECSAPQIRIGVEVIQSDTHAILVSQELKLSHGSTRVTFPPNEQFAGVVSLIAYPVNLEVEPYSMYSRTAGASVLFPKPHSLQLDVKPVKTTYRPGESATVNLRVRGSDGEAAEDALGLVVYDQAIEELARAEASLSAGGYEQLDPRLGFRSLDEDSDSIGGVSLSQLLNREPQAPVPADLELVAQALLFKGGSVSLRAESSDTHRYLDRVFQKQIHSALDPVTKFLQEHFTDTGHFPADDGEYARLLKGKHIDVSGLLDPWGRPYHVRRAYQWMNEVFEFRSEGPDKTLATSDDFTAMSLSRPFFEHDGKRLRAVIDAYHARTGGYIRDQATLEAACAQEHISLSGFVDPWGTPYRFLFEIVRDNYTIYVESAGPDKRFRSSTTDPAYHWYELVVAVENMPYFRETAERISDALFESAKTSAHFPENEEEFRKVMADHEIDWDTLRDPWGRSYRVVPTVETGYSDRITMHAYGEKVSTSQAPVSRTMKVIRIISDGPDLTANTGDDFVLASFASPFLEETGGTTAKIVTAQKPQPVYSGNSGAIRVLVKDPAGAVVTNAKVTLTNEATGIVHEGNANDQGFCLLASLSPGTYRVLVESSGFRAYVLTNIPVLSSNVTEVEVTLQLGATTETVEVSEGRVALQTEVSQLAALAPVPGLVLTTKSGAASGQIKMPVGTPRLRKYFPETLLWQPEIHTGRGGHTTVKVPLADSITTWKVSVIASTLEGYIATASADIRAFLPFFVELEPPKVLTVGDELHLPVTLRNYLDKSQAVSLEWSAEPWSETLSQRTARINVPAGDYAEETFFFRAARPMKDAKQRLAAFNRSSANDSDAIEKKLLIHADGQQRLVQANSIFAGDTSLLVEIPENALAGSVEAELVLYSSLIAHVSDAIEGIMERPYGCAEQTISSAYPSLLWLQLQKSRQLPTSPVDARARHYLKLAYGKLLRYRELDGGFSLWGKGQPELSVSAYALRFLMEASEFIEVDSDVVAAARRWMLQQAAPQGGWMEKDSNGKYLEGSGLYLTAYVVEALARDLQRRSRNDKDLEPERQTVRNGIAYLSKSARAASDPYDIALIALAKLAGGDDASQEMRTLLSLERSEGEGSYWDLYHNTIFYGWGYTGRIETTALVLDALALAKQRGQSPPEFDRALNRGTLFLLRNKDRYGVWYSTQATVDVLQTLVRQLEGESADASRAPVRIFVDGKPGPVLSASSDARQLTPQRVDLTPFLAPGKHTIELRGGSAHASVYVNASYYLAWTDPAVTGSSVPSGEAESLRYSVKFDRSMSSAGDLIRCTVHAERVGFRGYGMMLAEVGLPPGVDVDRASLDSAVSTSGWDLQSYEVQPDRVAFYLWPRAGGTSFSFTFKPRFAMTAQSSESILYDYYNPEARASVPPTRFQVEGTALPNEAENASVPSEKARHLEWAFPEM